MEKKQHASGQVGKASAAYNGAARVWYQRKLIRQRVGYRGAARVDAQRQLDTHTHTHLQVGDTVLPGVPEPTQLAQPLPVQAGMVPGRQIKPRRCLF